MKRLSSRATILVLLFVFVLGVGVGQLGPSAQASGSTYAKLDIFAKVLSYVQNNYVDDVNEQDLVYGAIRGMLETLDPHTNFLPPDVYREMKIDTSGEFFGIGIVIEPRERRLRVVEVLPGAPAARVGILKGDQLATIDGRETMDLPLTDAINLLRGPAGSSVKLGIQREGNSAVKEFVVPRERVRMASVEGRLLEGGIGYLQLKQFQDRTATQFVSELQKLQVAASGSLQGVIVDLRGNPGGLLDEAVRVADEFLASGVIVSTEGRHGANREEELAHKSGHYQSGKLVLLIDRGSASAAEVLAGALKDQGRAILIGTRTYGKGSVQNIIDLDDGSGLKLTVARYYTPKRICIDGKGIAPDIQVVDPNAARLEAEYGVDEDRGVMIEGDAPSDPTAQSPAPAKTDAQGERLLAAMKAPVAAEDLPLRAAYAYIKLGGLPN